MSLALPRCQVVSTEVNVSNYEATTDLLVDWSRSQQGRVVCVAPVHPIMEAFDKHKYRAVLNAADFVTADGMPVVWSQRLLGFPEAERVYGPTLTLRLCERCAGEGIPIGLYGGSPAALEAMQRTLRAKFPRLEITYAVSPPFRELTEEEDAAVVEAIRASGCRVLFVGLGTPKQDLWMAAHRDRLPLVQIGVGAAFDFISGRKRQAPAWMQRAGLEWFFRLCCEPRRLWFRYFWHNPRFVALVAWQCLGRRKRENPKHDDLTVNTRSY